MRKYLGVPIAVLLVIALAGTAIAWYCFDNISSTTDVKEPLSTANETEFSAEMYPGQSKQWEWDIVNSAAIRYSVKADLTYNAPSGVSISSFKVSLIDKTDDLTDDGSAEFHISGGATVHCVLTIKAAKDATPGPVSVTLVLSRE